MFWSLLVVLLFVMCVAAMPRWPHSRTWGYYPSVGLGVVVAVLAGLLVTQSIG